MPAVAVQLQWEGQQRLVRARGLMKSSTDKPSIGMLGV
jgi:hypothetical protein